MLVIDVLLEERAVGRRLVDVALFDFDSVLVQKTSGVAACSSGGLPVEDGLGHPDIVGGLVP
jgi:hypothetical protein